MYSLQKYAGVASRHTCPGCGGKRCFTLYVDESGNPLHETVGKCDHLSSCGYHYTPKQYFRDHPEAKPGKDWREADPSFAGSTGESPRTSRPAPKPKPLCFIPDDIVTRSVRLHCRSQLVTFLESVFDPVIVEQLVLDYRLGVTRSRAVIFFQIDAQGRCRTGKIMMYDPETGHRIKNPDQPGRIDWVHSNMKKLGLLPADWELTQCLFGEHLLSKYPDRPVALVESEKTAVICSAIMPRFVWLATGGKSQISAEKLSVLKGRRVTAFPDVDGFSEWQQKLSAIPGLNVTVADALQQEATAEDFRNHIDIADWLLRTRHSPAPTGESPSRHARTFLRIAQYVSPESASEVEALIEDLGLEWFGKVEKVEKVEEGEPP